MSRSFRTWSLSALLLGCTAVLVGCGSDKKENPKVKGDAPGLNERPAPVAPGGDGKKTTTTNVGPGSQ
jgi:hypothetical protein